MRWATGSTPGSRGRASNTPWGRCRSRCDQFRLILRIETTVVNVSFFKHYREVEHQDGTSRLAWAEMKKTIYSLDPWRQLLLAANRRYLEFISTIEEDKAGTDKLNKISQPVEENDRNIAASTSSIRRTRNY